VSLLIIVIRSFSFGLQNYELSSSHYKILIPSYKQNFNKICRLLHSFGQIWGFGTFCGIKIWGFGTKHSYQHRTHPGFD
jgi:hypothetical protein